MKQEPPPVQDEYATVIFSQETISYLKEDRVNILMVRATENLFIKTHLGCLNRIILV